MKKKILAIAGSIRKNSVNKALLSYISNTFKEDFSIEIYNQVGQLPIFNPDLEGDLLPVIIKELQAKIIAADGIIISTPEYVYSLPGNLKNLLEWNVSSTVFYEKPIALIVAAASGKKAFESIDLVMSTITCAPIPEELKAHFQGIGKKINIEGDILDTEIIEKLNSLMKAFSMIMDSKSTNIETQVF